jgi:dienelactone hydrolase
MITPLPRGRAHVRAALLVCASITTVLWPGLAAGQSPAQDRPTAAQHGLSEVPIEVSGARAARISGYLMRATVKAAAPAVVAMHGCGGLLRKNGRLGARELDWAGRLSAAGYHVLLLDSFTAHGRSEICTLKLSDRPITARDRAEDGAAAIRWLAAQEFVNPSRLALLGWSNGGTAVLYAAGTGVSLGGPEIRAAISFYPGCRVVDRGARWQPRVPVTILIGSDDDWTPPAPCRELAGRGGVRLVEYPGAVHGFDAPASKRRTRTDVGSTRSGRAEVGTDPAARAAAIDEVLRTLGTAFAGDARR